MKRTGMSVSSVQITLMMCCVFRIYATENMRTSIMTLSDQVRDLQHRQERSTLEEGRDLADLLEDVARIKETNDERNSFLRKLVLEFFEKKDSLRMKLKEASSAASRILSTLERNHAVLRARRNAPTGTGHMKRYFRSIADKVADLADHVQAVTHDLKRKSVVNENCFKSFGRGDETSILVTAWCPPLLSDTGKRTCSELLTSGHHEDGVYGTRLEDKIVATFCDMSTDGGGWNVLLRSQSPVITSPESASEFHHLWNPIGDLTLDFWWGWKNVLHLTHSQLVELKVVLTRPRPGNATDEYQEGTLQQSTVERDGNRYILTSELGDEAVNKSVRVLQLMGERAQVYDGDGRKIAECPAQIVRRVYLAEEVVSFDLKCLGALFAGMEAGYSGIVVMVRPALSTA